MFGRRIDNPTGAVKIAWEVPFAIVAQHIDLDYGFSIALWERAREFGWNPGQVHNAFATNYAALGELDTAIQYFRAAIEGDAQLNHTRAMLSFGQLLLAAGQYEEAVSVLARAVEMTSAFDTELGAALAGSHASALAMIRDPAVGPYLSKGLARYRDAHPHFFVDALVQTGQTLEARRILEDMEVAFANGSLRHSWPAFLGHWRLNELDTAFLWLDRVIDNRESRAIPQIKNAGYLAPLREDRRFAQALKRLQELEAQGSPLRSLVAQAGIELKTTH